MQMKIDQLEERIQSLQQQLRQCEDKIMAVTTQCELEKGKVVQLNYLQ
jgi:predicted  nucleic acid-binding Zn-ribbon protein